MPTILDKILAVKRREVADLAPRLAALKAASRRAPPPRSLARALRRPAPPADPIRLIAEVKHRSPSAGVLIDPYDPAAIARRYAAAGVDAILVGESLLRSGDIPAKLAEFKGARPVADAT